MELSPGATLHAGRYELVRRLGTGGFGEVWQARDTRLGRAVAVKVLHRDEIPGLAAAQRFAAEAQAASNLRHPNIVTVYDYVEPAGGTDDPALLVMDLVEGRTLQRLLDDFGPAPDDRLLAWGRQIAEALGTAHTQQPPLLHRDVKPQNIIVRDDDGTAHLVDFGIAVMLDAAAERLTQVGHVIGSPRYMSPEQQTGFPLSPASDVYSLGVVLGAARSKPGDTVPGGTDAGFRSAALTDVLARALLPDAAARYQNGFEFASALRAVAEGGQQALAAARDAGERVAAAGLDGPALVASTVVGALADRNSAPTTIHRELGRPITLPAGPSGQRAAPAPAKRPERTGRRRTARRAAIVAALVLALIAATVVVTVLLVGKDDASTAAVAAPTTSAGTTTSASSTARTTTASRSTTSSSATSTASSTGITRATPTAVGVPWSPGETFVGLTGERTTYSTSVTGLVDGTPVSDGIAMCWAIDDSPGTSSCLDFPGTLSADFRVTPATRVTTVIGLADYSPLSCEAQITVLDGQTVVADQSTTAGAVRLDDYVMQSQVLQVQVQVIAGTRGQGPSNCAAVIGVP